MRSLPDVMSRSPLASCGRIVRFFADRTATSATEFAILIPIFTWLVFEVAQVGLYFFYSASLYNVVNRATRQILTGSVASQGLTAAQYRTNVLCPLLPSNMSCANIVTNIQIAPSYAAGSFYNLTNYVKDVNNPLGYDMTGLTAPPMNNNLTSFCTGANGAMVAVQVYYAMPIIGVPSTLPGTTILNGQQVIYIEATSVFMNEPFPATNNGC